MILIEKIVPGGQGLGTLDDGRKIFLWNTLPGEVVEEYEILKKKTHYLEGVATKILGEKVNKRENILNTISNGYISEGNDSGDISEYSGEKISRVVVKDECYLATSPWQIMGFKDELKIKGELVKENFRQAGISISLPEVVTDNKEYFYRNKMEYALYWDKDLEKIRLAFHMRGSHRKIPIFGSSIERPEIFQRAVEMIDDLNKKGEEARKYQSLILRCNKNGEVAGGLLENGKPHPIFPKLTDEILGQKYNYSPNGFFQINLPVYELALLEIKKQIKTEQVLDLYSGVGTIGLSVAGDKKLVLVECNKFAYEELVNNAQNNLGEIQTVLSNSEEALEYIKEGQTVILDPPRAGCDTKLIERILAVGPEKIIYLSCNPATQARDIKRLMERYIIYDIKTFNFFPKTPHIENLMVLNLMK